MDHEAFDDEEEPHDRDEVLLGIERNALVEERRDAQRIDRQHAQRVAVGLRLRAGLRADERRAARAILDDHGLTERLGQLLSERAQEHVAHAAGTERHDHPDGLVRIVLGNRAARSCHEQKHDRPQQDDEPRRLAAGHE